MPTIQEPNFGVSEIPLSERNDYPEVDMTFLQTLARLMGYDRANEIWRTLNVDAEGNIGLNLSLSAIENAIASNVSVAATATLLVSSRSDRKRLSIFNSSATSVLYVSSSETVAIATGYQIYPQVEKVFDGFVGAMYGVRGSALTAYVLEEF